MAPWYLFAVHHCCGPPAMESFVMNEPSEAEVEAARAALRDQFDIWVAPISMRAALTAAAQVRERAPTAEDFFVACAWATCQGKGFPAGYGAGKLASQCACIQRLKSLPSTTEPDSGPDVLGIQKGEE